MIWIYPLQSKVAKQRLWPLESFRRWKPFFFFNVFIYLFSPKETAYKNKSTLLCPREDQARSLKVLWQIISLFLIYRMNEDAEKYLALICCKIWDKASWRLNWCPTEEQGSCQHALMAVAGECKPTPYSSVLCLWLLLPEHQKPWWPRKQKSGNCCPKSRAWAEELRTEQTEAIGTASGR